MTERMKKFMPKEQKKGYCGFYPVTNAEEWDELPVVYKAMEWFPVDVFDDYLRRKVRTIPEYVLFDAIYVEPYGIHATVKVHVQEVQKILFCNFPDSGLLLHSICGVVFQNGEEWMAEWKQDTRTGAFGVYAYGKLIGRQGGYLGAVPENIEETEDGFKWKGFGSYKNRCHYELSNPFEHIWEKRHE